MRQLILFRHAKAVPADGHPDDFERELAATGRTDAPLVAKALADAGAAPTVALVSEARRTRETWEAARQAFPKTEAVFLGSLYLAPAETLLLEAERVGAANVMVIAHNPGLHELAARLAHRNASDDVRVRAKFPTAACALFERKDATAAWRLAAYVTPKDLRG
jgi:phosphohistidine phosphatase